EGCLNILRTQIAYHQSRSIFRSRISGIKETDYFLVPFENFVTSFALQKALKFRGSVGGVCITLNQFAHDLAPGDKIYQRNVRNFHNEASKKIRKWTCLVNDHLWDTKECR